MKRVLLLLTVNCLVFIATAQNRAGLRPWCMDVNLFAGGMQQQLSTINFAAAYPAALNSNISKLNAAPGGTFGMNIGIGYFFGRNKNWGLGTGVLLLHQKSNISLDNFYIEYRSLDYNKDTFRQVLSANGPIRETIQTTNINIPLVVKYQHHLSRKWNITADAGILFNIITNNKYKASASFNHEALYKFQTGSNTPVYDYSPVPDANDWKITRDEYYKDNKDGDAIAYFNRLRTQGYNVGLGVSPDKASGNILYRTGSIGFIVHPGIAYALCNNLQLNAGLYYIIQAFSTNMPDNYITADRAGTYSSMLNGVTKTRQVSYGGELGIRFFFGKHGKKESNKQADTLIVYQDTSGFEHTKITDADEDGIADNEDSCRYEIGQKHLHGCPDTERYSQPAVLDKKNPADSSDKNIPDKLKLQVPEAGQITDPQMEVLFDIGKTTFTKSSYEVLNRIVALLQKNENMTALIEGYTDNKGSKRSNLSLSVKRAVAVKRYLASKGIDVARLKARGHGSNFPVNNNNTKVSRAQNRRVIINTLILSL